MPLIVLFINISSFTVFSYQGEAHSFVTFSKSNAKALLTACGHQKCNLQRKASHSSQVLRSSRSKGRPLKRTPCTPSKRYPCQCVTMVTMFLRAEPVCKTSSPLTPLTRVVTLSHCFLSKEKPFCCRETGCFDNGYRNLQTACLDTQPK